LKIPSLSPGRSILEDGIQIYFAPPESKAEHHSYRSGDYWLIPARTATGNVEWPKDGKGDPVPWPPHGVEHHYAPLAIINIGDGGEVTVPADLRHKIEPLGKPV
jgi:hypothetical protein